MLSGEPPPELWTFCATQPRPCDLEWGVQILDSFLVSPLKQNDFTICNHYIPIRSDNYHPSTIHSHAFITKWSSLAIHSPLAGLTIPLGSHLHLPGTTRARVPGGMPGGRAGKPGGIPGLSDGGSWSNWRINGYWTKDQGGYHRIGMGLSMIFYDEKLWTNDKW